MVKMRVFKKNMRKFQKHVKTCDFLNEKFAYLRKLIKLCEFHKLNCKKLKSQINFFFHSKSFSPWSSFFPKAS